MSRFTDRVEGQIGKVEERLDIVRERLLRGQLRAVRRRIAQMLLKTARHAEPLSNPIATLQTDGSSVRLARRDGRTIPYIVLDSTPDSFEWSDTVSLLPRLGIGSMAMTVAEAERICRRRRRNRTT